MNIVVNPCFTGRSEELEKIKVHWRKACEGHPQVVTLVADTGVGKTRLVHAFYEWLSTHFDQGNVPETQSYWPDEIGFGLQRVNPPLERFTAIDLKKDRIPWLWWGMYWTDGDVENDPGVSRFHEKLDVHLKMIERQRAPHRHTWTTVISALKDEAINLAAGFVPGGGQVVTLAKVAMEINQKREEQKAAQEGLALQEEGRQKTLSDSVIDQLKNLFNGGNKDTPPLPMVLFLDDIHFATDISRDETTLEFLDKLLHEAAKSQWPLLVLATHWKGLWQHHLKGNHSGEHRSWRAIMRGLEGDESNNGPSVHTIEIYNLAREGLRSIALDMLPGLSRSDQEKILSRVDNVRWLVEFILAMKGLRENFEDNDPIRGLSTGGHQQMQRLLETGGYLEVIRKRMAGDHMQEVRAVLGAMAWHAQGLEFVTPLARAFGETLVRHKALTSGDSEPGQYVLEVLLQALDPEALLEGDGWEGGVPLLVRFPERGYMEIARQHFSLERLPELRLALGEEVIVWMKSEKGQTSLWEKLKNREEKTAFLSIAVAVFRDLQPRLNDEQAGRLAGAEDYLRIDLHSGKITNEIFEEECRLFKQTMLKESQELQLVEAGKYQAIAMAELIHIDGENIDDGDKIRFRQSDRGRSLAKELVEHPEFYSCLNVVGNGVSRILSATFMGLEDGFLNYSKQIRAIKVSLVESSRRKYEDAANIENKREMQKLLRCWINDLSKLALYERTIATEKRGIVHDLHIKCLVLSVHYLTGETHSSLELSFVDDILMFIYGLDDIDSADHAIKRIRLVLIELMDAMVQKVDEVDAPSDIDFRLASLLDKLAGFERIIAQAAGRDKRFSIYLTIKQLGVYIDRIKNQADIRTPFNIILPIRDILDAFFEGNVTGDELEEFENQIAFLTEVFSNKDTESANFHHVRYAITDKTIHNDLIRFWKYLSDKYERICR
jgi:hypothetical protein